jgi:predicted enzyme related to lactoylglutathione lyase
MEAEITMITGVHALFYTTDPEAARAFIRDKLQLPHFEAMPGWPLFDAPSGIIGCHPATEPAHGIAFSCDDIQATISELQGRGVRFLTPVDEQPWGWTTEFEVPGAGAVQLYQAKYSHP